MFPQDVGLWGVNELLPGGITWGSASVLQSLNAFNGLKSRIQSGCTVDQAKEGSG